MYKNFETTHISSRDTIDVCSTRIYPKFRNFERLAKAPKWRSRKSQDRKNIFEYSLNDFNNDLLLVVFICNHCPYVHARLDDIIALQEKYKDNLCVVGINSNDSNYEGEGFENMVKYTKKTNMRIKPAKILKFNWLWA